MKSLLKIVFCSLSNFGLGFGFWISLNKILYDCYDFNFFIALTIEAASFFFQKKRYIRQLAEC
jgi:hypothetical protein